MSEKTMTLREAEALIVAAAGPEDFGVPAKFAQAAKNYAEFVRAHLAQPAQAVDVGVRPICQNSAESADLLTNTSKPQAVDAAMVERALTYRARQEDGAVWPDAYGAEEQAAEREQMWAILSEALNPSGPKAYCRACQRAGMSNCGYFDECTGATCITCHRPFVATRALSGEKAGPVGDGWQPIETAPYGTSVLAWIYLPKNPRASACVIAQRCYVEKEDGPEYPDHQRITVGCWWANGRYYAAGHVTHWMSLPASPTPDKEG